MILDTGILVAAADTDDEWHEAARDLFVTASDFVITELIVAETDHLLGRRLGERARRAFRSSLDRDLVVVGSTAEDRTRARAICDRYADLELDFTDAITVAIAERLGERRIATKDRRDFVAIRPLHVAAFELLPVRN